MKTFLKTIGALSLLLALVVLGATVYIKKKYPPARIKALVEEQVKERLHRELRLGDVSVGLWSGLSLEKIELSENPGFAGGTFLSAEKVSVEPFLLPLLKGRVVVKRVSLKGPSVKVVRFPGGRFNFSDLTGPAAAPGARPSPTGGGPSAKMSLLVNAVSIKGGAFSFDDRQGGLKASVRNLSLDVAGFSLSAPFSAALSCAVDAAPAGKPALTGTLSFKGRLSPSGEGKAEIDSLTFASDAVNLDIKGSVANFSSPDADLALTIKSFEARALAPFAALPPALKDASLQGELRVKGGAAALSAKGTFKVAAAGASAGAALDAAVKNPAGTPSFDGTLSLSDLRVEKSPLAPGLSLSGPGRTEVKVRGSLAKMSASLSLAADGAALAYGTLFAKPAGTALSAAVEAVLTGEKDVALSSARLTLAGASVDVHGTVADAPGAGRLDLAVKASPFDLTPFEKMIPSLAGYKLSGRAGLDATVKGTIKSPQARGNLALAGLGAVPMEGISFGGLTGNVSFTQDSLDLPGLKGKLNGETLSLKASVRNFARPDVTVDGNLASLDLGKLQAAFASTAPATAAPAAPSAPAGPPPIAKAKGSFKIGSLTHPYYLGKDFALTWDLTDLGPDLSRLNGTAKLSASDGKIRNLPLAAKINALLKRDAADITYAKLGGNVKITRGVLDTQDFAVDSDQADFSAKGSVNLADTVADLRLTAKLAKGAVGGSAEEWFTDDDGRVTVDFVIKGPLAKAVPVPDLRKAGAKAAKSLLKKYLGGAAAPAGSAPAPSADGGGSQTPQQKINDAAQKALRNFLKKKS